MTERRKAMTVRPTTSSARSSNFLKRTQPWKARPFASQFESPASPLATLRVTDNAEVRARIRRMRPSLTFSISLIIAANLHTAIAQSSPTPAPTPVTLRSLLLSELRSTHDNAEWFTPIKAAVAGLTAEQAKWVPQNAQGKTDSNAKPFGRNARLSSGFLERECARPSARRKACESGKQPRDV